MSKLESIQANAKLVHSALRNYYNAWEDLEQLANNEGYTLDTKTAELKRK